MNRHAHLFSAMPAFSCANPYLHRAYQQFATPRESGSKISRDGDIWTFMAIMSTISATLIPDWLRQSSAQLNELCFAPRRYTCTPAVELAEKLIEISPAGLDKVLFAASGSDAVEMALAYARAATGRFKTISFWDSYHGAGFGARSIGGEAMFRSGPIGPLLSGSEHVPPFGDYRNAWGVTEGSAELCAGRSGTFWKRKATWLPSSASRFARALRASTRILAHGATSLR